MSLRSVYWVVALIILWLVIFLLYASSLEYGYINRDSNVYLIDNPHIRALTWENIQWMFQFQHSNWTPLAWLSYAITYAFVKLDLVWHRLVSLVLHALNASVFFFLVFYIVDLHDKYLIKSGSSGSTFRQYRFLIALIAALLFAIHPQHVESVVWLAERKGLLASLFMLLSLQFYLLYSVAQTRNTKIGFYLATLICISLALGSKPIAVTLPFLMLLLDIYPLKKLSLSPIDWNEIKQCLLEKLPFFILVISVAFIGVSAQSDGGALTSLSSFSVVERLMNVFTNIWLYISKFLFPLSLSPVYPFHSYEVYASHSLIVIPFAGVFLVTFLCLYQLKKGVIFWLIAWLFYIVSLLPTSGLVQFGDASMADRFVYFPTAPFYILLSVGFIVVWQYKPHIILNKLLVFVLCAVLGLLLFLSHTQIKIWSSPYTFWNHVVTSNPDIPIAHGAMADILFHDGQLDTAQKHYQEAIKLEEEKSLHHPDKVYHFRLIEIYLIREEFDKVFEVMHSVLNQQTAMKNKAKAAYILADISFSNQQWQQASYYLDLTLHFDIEYPQAHELQIKLNEQKAKDLFK